MMITHGGARATSDCEHVATEYWASVTRERAHHMVEFAFVVTGVDAAEGNPLGGQRV